MAFYAGGKRKFTFSGTPYVWGTEGVTPDNFQTPTRVRRISHSTDHGTSVAATSGRAIIGGEGTGNVIVLDDFFNPNTLRYTTLEPPYPRLFGTDDQQFGRFVGAGCGRFAVTNPYADVGGIINSGRVYLYDTMYDWDGRFLTDNELNNTPNLIKVIDNPRSNADSILFGFGRPAIGNGRLAIPAPYNDVDGVSNSGEVYLYDLQGNYLKALGQINKSSNDVTGYSEGVAIGNGRIVIGAYTSDKGGPSSGEIAIFDIDGGYINSSTSAPPVGNDLLGRSVDVGCGMIVAGSYLSNDSYGGAVVYDLDGNFLYSIVSNVARSQLVGHSVAVGHGIIALGGHAQGSGVVSLYNLDGVHLIDLHGNNNGDLYGYSVCIKDNFLIVGTKSKGYTDIWRLNNLCYTMYDAIDILQGDY